MSANDLAPGTLVAMWRDMLRIRAFEQAALYQSSIGNVYGALHSYEGQESCAVGICSALREGDYAASTHRGHGHTLVMGARMDRMMAELFGRRDGCCRGKGGSLHIADLAAGMLGANGIVGAGYAIAAGAALRAKVARSGRVAVVFSGEGAATRGTFHEVMNMASLWKLPLLLVCENNEYAQYVHWSETTAFDGVASLAEGYKVPGVRLDGNDIRAVHAATGEAAARARAGDGPTLIELRTQRSTATPQEIRRCTGLRRPWPNCAAAAIRSCGSRASWRRWALSTSLAGRDVSVEVIDPRTVSPIDWERITASVAKTGRALVVNEATLTCSVASEIAATIGERCFADLDAPVRRLGSPFVPKPATPGLEKLAYPSIEGIIEAVLAMMPRQRVA